MSLKGNKKCTRGENVFDKYLQMYKNKLTYIWEGIEEAP